MNGDYWARLGEARFGAQDYAGARADFENVLRLGMREPFLAYRRNQDPALDAIIAVREHVPG